MRKLVALLSMWVALSATATELWRWKDADGVTHYSDRPAPGAERIDVQATQRSSGASEPSAQAVVPSSSPPPPAAVTQYTRCAVAAPMNDEVFNNPGAVSARVDVEPALQPGHRLQVLLNGSAFAEWPANQFAYTLNVYRGSYTLNARVVNANGRVLCAGSAITFHVRQPSVLAPGRKPSGG
jgi:hypothetical protein